jgi:predicted Zn-dependent peptidase
VLSVEGGPALVFHRLDSPTVGLYLALPGGILGEPESGGARAQLDRLLGDLGLDEAVADLGGRLEGTVGLRAVELRMSLPPESTEELLRRLADALAAARTPRVRAARAEPVQDLLREASMRRVVEELLLDLLLRRDWSSAPDEPAAVGPGPGGAVLALVGPLDAGVQERAALLLEPWRQAAAAGTAQPSERQARAPEQRIVWIVRDEAPSAGILAWLVPAGPAVGEPHFDWDLVAAWLGRGPRSPLEGFRRRGPGRVAEAFCWDFGSQVLLGTYFEGELGEAPQLRQTLLAALGRAASGSVSEAEVERARWALKVDHLLEAGTAQGMARLLGRAQLAGAADAAWDRLRRVADLGAGDLRRAAVQLHPEALLAVGRGTPEEARNLATRSGPPSWPVRPVDPTPSPRSVPQSLNPPVEQGAEASKAAQ